MTENHYQSPKSVNEPPPVTASVVGESDVVSAVIPYKNKAALIAYYSGVFSVAACLPLIGIIGVVLAVVAVVFGVKGLRYAKEHPEARGRIHCWIGILGGAICGLIGLAMQALIFIAMLGSLVDAQRP
jgi:hypothetical protein